MSTTYRYGVAIFGASYALPDREEPSHFVMAETLSDVVRILRNARENYPWRYDLDGNGQPIKSTPAYGYEGDGADVYRVERDNPQFAEVLDEPGDRARHAWSWMLDEPTYRYTFGPRGGIQREMF